MMKSKEINSIFSGLATGSVMQYLVVFKKFSMSFRKALYGIYVSFGITLIIVKLINLIFHVRFVWGYLITAIGVIIWLLVGYSKERFSNQHK
ncbi:MAG: hypothetical protein HYV32_06830 [Candidatus Kerfeldbacteria bacterium]|nr:hypothetical protein [Candidatus Kerfeldbacteria bacterium]